MGGQVSRLGGCLPFSHAYARGTSVAEKTLPQSAHSRPSPMRVWLAFPPFAYLVLEVRKLLAIPVHQRLRVRVQELRHACLLAVCVLCRVPDVGVGVGVH